MCTTFYLPGVFALFGYHAKCCCCEHLCTVCVCEHVFCPLGNTHRILKLVGYMVTLCLTFWGAAKLFSTMTVPFYFPYFSVRILVSTSLPTCIVSFLPSFKSYTHPGGCVVVSHCGFDLYFPNEYWFLVSFHVPLWPLVYLLWKNVHSITLPFKLFVFLLMSCKSSLYVLDIRPLSDTWFANNFTSFCFLFFLRTTLIMLFDIQKFQIC